MDEKITVAFTGGGTGGHIYPGLAVADALRTLYEKEGKKVSILWIGSSSGMDKKIVESATGSDGKPPVDVFYGVPSGKLRRYFSLQNVIDVFKIILGCICSFFILIKNRPSFIFSKGGFVSVPPCFAAKLLKIKVFTHECDYTPGLATRINSRFASKILLSYKETAGFFPLRLKSKTEAVGNPVRPVFYNAEPEAGMKFLNLERKELPVLLVMGGSLGARQINELVYKKLDWLCSHFIVVHQTGDKNFSDAAFEKTPAIEKNYHPYPFIYSEMPHVMALSDIVLSRAGANSIWECAVLAKPMILIPLTGAGTRGDQVDNAEFFAKKGCACVMTGSDVNSSRLQELLSGLESDDSRRPYAEACRKLTEGERPVQKIADILYDIS